MIAKNLLLYLILIIVPDLYIFKQYIRPKKIAPTKKLLWFIPMLVMIGFTLYMATSRHFAPDDYSVFTVYLAMFGLLVCTKLAFMLFSVIGRGVSRLCHSRKNWGNLVGLIMAFFTGYATIYGLTSGFTNFDVNRYELTFKDLPAAFDGYRIVLFSDAHVGSFTGCRAKMMREAYDSINAQQADAIFFVGDLQNVKPDEIEPHRHLLNSLQSRDGVFSVLGNHDYSMYFNGTDEEKAAVEADMIEKQRQLGWRLLNNENAIIRHGGDSIFIAGMENDGEGRFVQKGDLTKTVEGIPDGAFTIMLQHDPSSWRRTILPGCKAQLTLSGHTHGGQVGVLGLTAYSFLSIEHDGLYTEGDRMLLVSRGLGGLLPFRYGVTAEIVVITLKKGH